MCVPIAQVVFMGQQERRVKAKAGLAGPLGGMSLEECTRRGQRYVLHILVVAYRNTTHYSIKAPWNRCLVRWASQVSSVWKAVCSLTAIPRRMHRISSDLRS